MFAMVLSAQEVVGFVLPCAKSAKPSYWTTLGGCLVSQLAHFAFQKDGKTETALALSKQNKKDCNYSAAETRDSILFEEGIKNSCV